MSNFSYLSL